LPNPCHYQNYDRSMLYPAQHGSDGCSHACSGVGLQVVEGLTRKTSLGFNLNHLGFNPNPLGFDTHLLGLNQKGFMSQTSAAERGSHSSAVLIFVPCVRAARPSGRARCGPGAGCSAIKYQSLFAPGAICRIWTWTFQVLRVGSRAVRLHY